MSTTVPKEPLRALFASLSGLPAAVVVWHGEPLPPVAPSQGGRLILNCTARRRVGRDEARREYPDASTIRTKYRGQRVLTISVRAENMGLEEGFDLLEDIRSRLEEPETSVTLNASDLSINDLLDVRKIDVNVGNRAISVAQMDVLFNAAITRTVDVTDTGGYIETVEMTGEDDLAVAGTFSVSRSGY